MSRIPPAPGGSAASAESIQGDDIPDRAASTFIRRNAANTAWELITYTGSNLDTDLSLKVTLAGLAGGQTIRGGTAASEALALKSTAHATKGNVTLGEGPALTVDPNNNVIPGTAALATSATNGFMYIGSCAGTPTGVPAASATGRIPLVFDSTNGILYAYNGAAWVLAVPAASSAPTTAQYVVLTNDATLTAERALAVDSTLALTDAGANSTVTLKRAALSGDVSASAGSNTTAIGANKVLSTMINIHGATLLTTDRFSGVNPLVDEFLLYNSSAGANRRVVVHEWWSRAAPVLEYCPSCYTVAPYGWVIVGTVGNTAGFGIMLNSANVTGGIASLKTDLVGVTSGSPATRVRFEVGSGGDITGGKWRLGFGANDPNTDNDGAYFRWDSAVNSSKFECVTRSGGTETATDSGITMSSSRVYMMEIETDGTSTRFYIDTVLVATNTTNRPGPSVGIFCGQGGGNVNMDFWRCTVWQSPYVR